MGKAIVVTGGLGFIGSHLCLRLLKDGHKVMCLDDLSTGQIEHLGMFDTYPNFKFIRHDIADPIFLKIRSMKYTILLVLHLLCIISTIL